MVACMLPSLLTHCRLASPDLHLQFWNLGDFGDTSVCYCFERRYSLDLIIIDIIIDSYENF